MTQVDLSTYVDATSDPMIVVSSDGTIVAANQPAIDTMGFKIGAPLAQFCKDPAEAARLSDEFRGSTSECLRKLRLQGGSSVMITGRRLGRSMRSANLISIRFDARTRLSTAFMALTLRLQENRRRLRDLEEERKLLRAENESLAHRAFHDGLTGLYNRAGFEDKLGLLLKSAPQGHRVPFAVLYLDLDRLKEVNDTYGHAAGDQMIQRFGAILNRSVRSSDITARLGGDEFAIILRGADSHEDVRNVTDRITAQVHRPVPLYREDDDQPHLVSQSVSIGAVLWPAVDASPDALMDYADHAMYDAKARGGGLCFFRAEQDLRLAN